MGNEKPRTILTAKHSREYLHGHLTVHFFRAQRISVEPIQRGDIMKVNREYIGVALLCAVIGFMISGFFNPRSTVKAQSTSTFQVQVGTITSGCAAGAYIGQTCLTTVYWPTSFVDNQYTVTCSPTDLSYDSNGNTDIDSLMSYDIILPASSNHRSPGATDVILRHLSGFSSDNGVNVYPQLNNIQCIAVHP